MSAARTPRLFIPSLASVHNNNATTSGNNTTVLSESSAGQEPQLTGSSIHDKSEGTLTSNSTNSSDKSHDRHGNTSDGNYARDRMLPYISVLDMLCHIPRFAEILLVADPLDIIGSENERIAFNELKHVVTTMFYQSAGPEGINLQPLINKIRACSYTNIRRSDTLDVLTAWDEIIKLIMVVIPPFREIFLGQVESAQEVPDWLNMKSYCFRAHYTHAQTTLDSIFRAIVKNTLSSDNQRDFDGISLRLSNALVIKRAPEIFVVQIDSGVLPTFSGGASMIPEAVTFPYSFDLETIFNHNCNEHLNTESSRHYELIAVSALDGRDLNELQSFFRVGGSCPSPINESGPPAPEKWYHGTLDTIEEVPRSRVVEGNFYHVTDETIRHPRLLVYTRKSLTASLERTAHSVTKGGLMRALGDAAFTLAVTPDNYSEARRCYEEAIALDESLRDSLQDKMKTLDKLEKKHRAHALEDQADLALANCRFREAGELYNKAMKFVITGSDWHRDLLEKFENVSRIIVLDCACAYTERGEHAMRNNLYFVAKDQFHNAIQLLPELLHLHTIADGIDKTIQFQIVRQKTIDANSAIKSFKYRLAQQLLLEAVSLAPGEQASLQPILDDLGPLIQSENAMGRQRAGVAAIDEKRFSAAVGLFTEAMSLLPSGSIIEQANILCDRAHAYIEMKERSKAYDDCQAALQLKPDLAMAYFRLGGVQFVMEQFDDALISFDKALKADASLSEQIKVKVRQVGTAKEVQQRKEREAERAKAKEEERRLLEEKKAREEAQRKEKAERLALEQAEKAERARIKEEERRTKALRDKELALEKEREKEAEKERLKAEKLERDAQKAIERERIKAEKEREKEQARLLKEKRAEEAAHRAAEEKLRQAKLAEERAAQEARQKELEREKEREKEAARLELERTIAERERIRQEKLQEEAEAKAAAAAAAAAALAATAAANSSKAASLAASTTAPQGSTSPSGGASTPAGVTASTPVQTGSTPNTPIAAAPVPIVAAINAGSASKFSSVVAANSKTVPVAGGPAVQYHPNPSIAFSNPRTQFGGPYAPNHAASHAQYPTASSAHYGGQHLYGDQNPYRTMDAPNPVPVDLSLNNLQDFPPLGSEPVPPTPSSNITNASAGHGSQFATGIASGQTGNRSSSWTAPANHPMQSSSNTNHSDIFGQNSLGLRYPEASEFRAVPGSVEFRPSPEIAALAEAQRQASLAEKAAGPNKQKSSESSRTNIFHSLDAPAQGLNAMAGILGSSSATGTAGAQAGFNPNQSLSSLFGVSMNANPVDSLGFDGNLALGSDVLADLGLLPVPNRSQSQSSDILNSAFSTSGSIFESPLLGGSIGGRTNESRLDALFSKPYANTSRASSFGFNIVDSPSDNPATAVLRAKSPSSLSNFGSESLNSLANSTPHVDIGGFRSEPSDFSIDEQIRILSGAIDRSHPNSVGPLTNGPAALSSSSINSNPIASSSSSLLSLSGDTFADPLGFGSNRNVYASDLAGGLLGSSGQRGGDSFLFSTDAGIGRLQPSLLPGFSNTSILPPKLPVPVNSLGSLSSSSISQSISDAITDADIVPENMFPSVAWLRQYDMGMFRWSDDSMECTEYAMHIPRDIGGYLFDSEGLRLQDLLQRTGCQVWLEEEYYRGQKETFLVFYRGSSMQPGNVHALNNALDNISKLVRGIFQGTSAPVTLSNPNSFASKVAASSGATPIKSGSVSPFLWGSSQESPGVSQLLGSDLNGLGDADNLGAQKKSLPLQPPLQRLKRPELLRVQPVPGAAYIQRAIEIPRETVGMIIGHAGKKIKELSVASGAKIQFKVNRSAEREGRPGTLEVQGSAESVDQALQMIWDLLQVVGKGYTEVLMANRK